MVTLSTKEGEVEFLVPGLEKPCNTWYKIVGKLHSSNSTSGNVPLVVLHGGPGAGHEYLLPLTDLVTKYSTPVIFYDQIGNGRSTHLPETEGDESFWREALFIRELDNLIDHLGLRSHGFHLFGHSWGGMFGSSYATSQPKGLRKLRAFQKLRSELPEDVQKAFDKAEKYGDMDSPEFQAAVGVAYQKYLCRVKPWPAPEVEAAMRWLEDDTTVHSTMNGPSGLTLTGSLKGWTVVDRLKNIEAPTLVYNGSLDKAQDLCVEPFFWNIPRVKWVILQDASYFLHVEHRDQVIKLIGDFLMGQQGMV